MLAFISGRDALGNFYFGLFGAATQRLGIGGVLSISFFRLLNVFFALFSAFGQLPGEQIVGIALHDKSLVFLTKRLFVTFEQSKACFELKKSFADLRRGEGIFFLQSDCLC